MAQREQYIKVITNGILHIDKELIVENPE